MPIFTPDQAAAIADGVYAIQDLSVSEALQGNTPLGIEGLFAATDSNRLKGQSGVLAWKTITGFGYIAEGVGAYQGECLIALRGTSIIQDWLTDANFLAAVGPTGTMVHKGFNQTWNSFSSDIRTFFDKKRPTRIHCVGHSLGGALATLTADYLKTSHGGADVQLYTFGSPRVGGMDFSRALTAKLGARNIHRVYHPADPVPMVPLFPFVHVPMSHNGLALRCDASKRIDFSAHSMANSYLKGVAGQQWAALQANGAQTLADRQIQEWLGRVSKGGGGVVAFGARTLELIGIALDWLLRKVAETILVGITASIGYSLTLLDQFAIMLQRGAEISRQISMYVEAVIAAIMRFLGRAVHSGMSLTVEFIRWALESMFVFLRDMAKSATSRPK